jgi:hypothetical protein
MVLSTYSRVTNKQVSYEEAYIVLPQKPEYDPTRIRRIDIRQHVTSHQMFLLQDISKPLIIAAGILDIKFLALVHGGAIFTIPALVLAPQQEHLQGTGHDHDDHGTKGHPHASTVVRGVTRRKHAGAQDRTALAAGGEDGQSGAAFRVRGVRVADPCEDHGDADETHDGEEEAEVAWPDARGGCEDDVADGSDESAAYREGTTQVKTIGDEGTGDNRDPAREVRRRTETVGLDRRERAHLGDDGRNEQGKGSETSVDTEVHQGREVT